MPKEKKYATTSWGYGLNSEEEDTNTSSVVRDWAAESNTVLVYLLGKIEAARPDVTAYILHLTWAMDKVERFGKVSFYPGPNDAYIIDDTILQIRKMIDANKGLISLIDSDGAVVDYKMYRVQEEEDKITVNINKVVVDDPPICSICSDVVVYDDLSDHQLGSACLTQKTNNAMESMGWVAIEQEQECDIAKATNVPYQMVAASFDMWAPSWVTSAIAAWTRHKGGFAGMTLTEYLDKMAANQVKK